MPPAPSSIEWSKMPNEKLRQEMEKWAVRTQRALMAEGASEERGIIVGWIRELAMNGLCDLDELAQAIEDGAHRDADRLKRGEGHT
jgi:hypothetical protein